MTALAGIRVLDMSGPAGNYCGKLFAELGAEVVLLEPPGGTAARRQSPFIGDEPGADRSLVHTFVNAGKRGIVLDLERPEGREAFKVLIGSTDLLIETERPGTLDALGLGYEELARLNPRLVVTSITPFGKTGPYAQYESDDLIALALGGLLYLGGYPDTPPLRPYGNQAYAAASIFGAVASMLALLEAEAGGEGQHVDVSMQACVALALETAIQFYDLEGTVKKRWGGTQRHAGTGVFPCKDGYIYFMAGGVGGNRFWKLTCDWLIEEGVKGAEQFTEERWLTHEFLGTDEAKRIFEDVFLPYIGLYTMAELYEMGQERHVPIAPVSTASDLISNEQLKYRDFFIDMSHSLIDGTFKAPGAPYKMSETPWVAGRPAPRLGEHTGEVLAEAGIKGGDAMAASILGVAS